MKERYFLFLSALLVVVLAVVWMIPIYALVTTSLKTQQEVALQKYLVPPQQFQFTNFAKAFQVLKIGCDQGRILLMVNILTNRFCKSSTVLSRVRFPASKSLFQ